MYCNLREKVLKNHVDFHGIAYPMFFFYLKKYINYFNKLLSLVHVFFCLFILRSFVYLQRYKPEVDQTIYFNNFLF